MALQVKQMITGATQPQIAVILPYIALRSVTSKSGMGVYASSDTLYKGAVFGRDSLEVAEDLLRHKQRLVRSILLTLARLQGTKTDTISEEEPGKIVHEYRNVIVDGKPIDKTSLEIFRTLSEKWGGNGVSLAYYGSIDATPHFVRVLDMYCRTYGNKILNENVTRLDGSTISLREAALDANKWLLKALDSSQSGLLEYKRTNPHGIMNQVWKDSNEFYVHENGEPANHSAPIASIEVQGLAYDALLAAGRLEKDKQKDYVAQAHRLRDRTLELLWQPDRNYFALGTDYDSAGKLRVIKTRTANPAALLDSAFFEHLKPDKKKQYVSALVEAIIGPDFITDAGIRSRSLRARHLVPYWDYHGSYVSWPKETYDIAKGLRRYGFTRLARQLENRLLNIYLKNRRYPEFVYVDELGRVLSVLPGSHEHGELIVVKSSNQPERVQAWTVSAIIAIMNTQLLEKLKPAKKMGNTWQRQLEDILLSRIPKVDLYINPFSLSARYPTYRYRLKSS